MYEQCWTDHYLKVSAKGYVYVREGGKTTTAHRVSFRLHYGFDPLVVRHTCDVRHCYNPKHLVPGNYKDNTRDMMERGRNKPGGRSLNAGMPRQLEDKKAYDIERGRRMRAGTWVTRRPV